MHRNHSNDITRMYCQKLDEFYIEKYSYESFFYLILPSHAQNKMKTENLFILWEFRFWNYNLRVNLFVLYKKNDNNTLFSFPFSSRFSFVFYFKR